MYANVKYFVTFFFCAFSFLKKPFIETVFDKYTLCHLKAFNYPMYFILNASEWSRLIVYKFDNVLKF